MNKTLLVLTLAIAAGVGAVLYFEEQRISDLQRVIRSLRASLASLNDDAEQDRAELKRLREQLEAMQLAANTAPKQDATGAVEERTAGSSGAASAPEAAAGQPRDFMKGLAQMFTDPEMKKTMKAQQAIGIRMMYGELFKQLGLSPEENEQIIDILSERQMEISSAAMKAMNAGGKPDEADQAKVTEAQQRYDEQLKATLGDEKYQTLQNYEKTIGDRFMLQQFEGQFAAAGAPLEPAQRETLLGIMQEERAQMPPSAFDPGQRDVKAQMDALNSEGSIDKFVSAQEAMNRRVIERARQTLSNEQVIALEKSQQQMLEMMRAQMKMSRAMFGK